MATHATPTGNWIVCGWYTPDYAHWFSALEANLISIGAPYDFVRVEKRPGGWEINTMSKAEQVRAAMDRHPDKTIIFIDVDCLVTGNRSDLDRLAAIGGDVGMYIRTRQRRNGEPKIGPRSGTMVFKSNLQARAFVEAWIEETAKANRYAVDQTSLAVALGRVPGLSITTLGNEFCAVKADIVLFPVISHDSASRNAKAGKIAKLFSMLRK